MALRGGLDLGRLVGRFHRGFFAGGENGARIPQAGFRLRPSTPLRRAAGRIC